MKSARYFDRFNKDYSFCVNKEFEQIYATSSQYSWSSGHQFKEFCKAADIPYEELHPENYFNNGMCDGAFRTREYTYDAMILKKYFLDKLAKFSTSAEIKCGVSIVDIERLQDVYVVRTADNSSYKSKFILNTTYAGTNQILDMIGFEKFRIKYELCEIILCEANEKLKDLGFTVMDGPFFSIMPFGKTGYHSLTSVTFTPHTTSYSEVPTFICQDKNEGFCSIKHLGNCNECMEKPATAFPYMSSLARKYMRSKYKFEYRKSLFSIKPILMSSEIDDSRPTVIRTHSVKPTFISVLSGKINTVYDLDEVLSVAE